jgi:hypothetical protein
LTALFGPRTRERDDRIGRFGDEIAYLIGEHPEFLARTGTREAASDAGATRTLLLSTGSPQLMEALATE